MAPERASTEPTERSMPAMMSTSVMPQAMMANGGIWLARVASVRVLRKLSLMIPKSAMSSAQITMSGA